jgi:hypothetical protein
MGVQHRSIRWRGSLGALTTSIPFLSQYRTTLRWRVRAPVIAGDLTLVNIPQRWSATFRLPSLCLPRKARITAAARTLRSDQLSHDASEPPRGDSPCGFGSTPYRHS